MPDLAPRLAQTDAVVAAARRALDLGGEEAELAAARAVLEAVDAELAALDYFLTTADLASRLADLEHQAEHQAEALEGLTGELVKLRPEPGDVIALRLTGPHARAMNASTARRIAADLKRGLPEGVRAYVLMGDDGEVEVHRPIPPAATAEVPSAEVPS